MQQLQAQESALRRAPEPLAAPRPPFRSLYPDAHDDVDPDEVVVNEPRDYPEDRPWVVLNLIASIDGVTAVGGQTAALSQAPDRAMFASLRAMADAVLVGAGTVRAEQYQAIALDGQKTLARRHRGQNDVPRLAIVTRKAELDLASPIITGGHPLMYVTDNINPMRTIQAEVVAEVIPSPGQKVSAQFIAGDLFDRGCALLLCEGGPTLASSLFDADVVDEVHLTIAPWLVGGGPAGLLPAAVPRPRRYELRGLLESQGMLFGRWVRARR